MNLESSPTYSETQVRKAKNVVFKFPFKLGNSFYVKGGFFLYGGERVGRDLPAVRPRFAHGELHLEPDAVAVLIRPYL